MQMKDVSSAWTFWMKIVFPVIWISGFGLAALLFWLGVMHDGNNVLPPPQMKFVFSGLWIVGATLILWSCAGLKRVRIDERQLYASNYLQEISLPFSAIIDVTQNRWINIRPVTVHLRDYIWTQIYFHARAPPYVLAHASDCFRIETVSRTVGIAHRSVSASVAHYSGLMPANLATLPHFSGSAST
jgi:hypothetical protein